MEFSDNLPQSNHNEHAPSTGNHLSQIVHELTGIIHTLASKVDVLCSRLGSQCMPSNGEYEYNPSVCCKCKTEYLHTDRHAPQGYRPVPAPRMSKVVSQSSSAKISKPLGQPPSFDGSGDLTIFKLLFQEWANLNGWDNDHIITLWLKQCLTGAAKMSVLYYNIEDSKTLFEKLDNMYGGNVMVQKYSEVLERRVKQPSESMSDLANDIRKMVEVIYADCDSYVRENMAINYFVRSLPSIHIRYELNKNKPKSLDQAVQSAVNHEFWFGNDFQPVPSEQLPICSVPNSDSILVENIDETISVSSLSTRRCTYCGKPHRDGKCLTHSRRTPYIKKNGKKKIKDTHLVANCHAQNPDKILSVSNQAPTANTCAVNSEVKFSHACHEGGTNLTGQRHSLC